MVEEIENCLKPVLQAVADDQLPVHRDWAMAMLQADSTGFLRSSALEEIVRGIDAVQ